MCIIYIVVQMKAVIKISGKQHIVSENDTIEIDKIDKKNGDKFTIPDVFLVADNEKTIIGKPKVKNALVEAEILEHKKGKKVKILKFRSKTGYKKNLGYRSKITKIKITRIKTNK